MTNPAAWRSRPVFITSTFRDMHAERDHLRAVVLLELEERLRERFHTLEPIDLRLGVETVSVDEEHARELLVLKVCLSEIERSRPFLIALIGDRYGWTPPEERLQAAAQEAGFKTDLRGKSITALEIEFGVLDSADQKRRTHIYLRSPLPYDKMDAATRAEYSERYNSAPGSAEAADRLAALKTRLKSDKSLAGRVHEYSATWDEKANRLTGLESWGRQVVEHIWADLAEETREFLRQQDVTWQEQERQALEEFTEQRSRGFVGRDDITRALLALALSPAADDAPWGVCVTGAPGSGKSALFAHLSRLLAQQEDVLVLANAPGAGTRSTRVDDMLRRWVDELAKSMGVPDPLTDASTVEEIEDRFREFLSRTSQRQRVVVLIDALNQFEPTTRARQMTWVPKLWPANARLITTAIPGTQSEALAQRPGMRLEPLGPLSAAEAREIAGRVYGRYHRTPNTEVLGVLTSNTRKDGTLAAGNPLWLELALEELNLLDADDFARAELEYTGRAGEKLHQLVMDVARGLPADVEGLYAKMLEKTEKVFGRAWARAFASVIALSRHGWRESDLRVLLPMLAGEPWEDLKFASLRRGFRAHLMSRGEGSQWDFFHVQMREAVLRRLRESARTGGPSFEEELQRIHTAIADHLLSLPTSDRLHKAETMYHLIGADDRHRAATYYSGDLSPDEVAGATRVLADHVLAGDGANPNPGLDWALSLPELNALSQTLLAGLSYRFIFDLSDALSIQGRLGPRRALLESAQSHLSSLSASDSSNADWQRDLSMSHIRIGDVLEALGDADGALEDYSAALAIAERLAAQDSSNADWQRDLSASHIKIGDVLLAQGDAGGALLEYRASHDIFELLAARDESNTDWQRNLSVSHEKIGDVLLAQGDTNGALEEYREDLAIAARLAAQDKSNTGWQNDLSVSHNKIGDVLRAQGDSSGALKEYRASLAIRERLAAQDPSNTGWQNDQSVSHNKIGDLLRVQGDAGGALKEYRAAQAIAERLAAQDPSNAGWRSDQSVSYIKIGDVLLTQGCAGGALKQYRAAMAIHERLAAQDKSNTGWQRKLSVSHDSIGNVLLAQGDAGGALEEYRASLAIREHLAAQDPSNAGWQRDLSVSHIKIGDALLVQDDAGGALREHRAARAIDERLTVQDPSNADWHCDLSVSHDKIGDALLAQGDAAGALKEYRAALAIRERLVAQDPSNADWQRDHSVSYERIGNVLLSQGDAGGALKEYRATLAIAERITALDPSNAGWQRDLSVSHIRIGDVLVGLEDAGGALKEYRAALAFAERLVAQDPSNAGWQRDLAVTSFKLATICEKTPPSGNTTEAQEHWRRCHTTLKSMKAAGMFLDPPLVQLLAALVSWE